MNRFLLVMMALLVALTLPLGASAQDDPEPEPAPEPAPEPEPMPESEPEPKKAPFGLAGWGYVGGGGGVGIGARKVHPTGRVTGGVGAQLFILYLGASADVGFSSHLDFTALGVAHVGVLIPIPAFKPFIGFKGGGGLHMDSDWGASPAITLGPEVGVQIGQVGGSRFGIRIAIEPAAVVSIKHRMAMMEIVGTVGVMF